MKHVSRLLVLVLVLVTLFSGSAMAQTDKKVIGVCMIDFTNQFYIDMMEAGDIAAVDYNVTLQWKSADGSIETQIAQMENFIQQKVDAIAVNPIDNDALISVVEEAANAGIPIVVMAGLVNHEHAVNTLYNDYNDTYLIAQLGAKLIGEEGKVVLLYGNKGNIVSDFREKGYLAAMATFPKIQVIEQPTDWDPAKGQQVMQDLIAANPDLKLMHSVSDAVTIGAQQSIIAAGLQDTIKITSYDGNKAACELVEKGEFYCTLLTGSKRVGYWNIKVAAKMANGERPPEKILYLPSHLVLTDEIRAKAEEWGLLKGVSVLNPQEAIVMGDAFQTDLGPSSSIEW
jgi:ribose transport system substrate-binding protein